MGFLPWYLAVGFLSSVLSVCAQGYPIGSESIYGKTVHFDGTEECLRLNIERGFGSNYHSINQEPNL